MNRWLRQLHRYLGVFFAPLLLLYIATGWWQTVTVNRIVKSKTAMVLTLIAGILIPILLLYLGEGAKKQLKSPGASAAAQHP